MMCVQPNERCARCRRRADPYGLWPSPATLRRQAICVAAGALLGAAPLIGWLVAPLLFG